MGGHGGLNILPQKSWNVYGRDNRERVLRDEAKHREELEAVKAKEEQAARSERHHALLSKARGDAQPEALLEETTRSKHINFWSIDESSIKDEDITEQAKKLAEARTRGDPSRQTTDARFDASFQLASGLQKASLQAWYVQPTAAYGNGAAQADEMPWTQRQPSVMLLDRRDGAPNSEEERSRKHHKKKSKKRDKEKHTDNKRSKSSRGVHKKSTEQLRQERIEREAAEKRRTVQALVGQARQ